MVKEVSKTCRTCLENDSELVPIYNGDDNIVVEMLEYILDTQLELTDGLPQKVCRECIKDISRCYSFKTKCNNSFKILKNLLDKRKKLPEFEMQIKIEPEVNIFDSFFEIESESQKTLNASRQEPTVLQMQRISIKREPTEIASSSDQNEMQIINNNSVSRLSQNQILTQQLQSNEKEIFPPINISSVSNKQTDSNYQEYFEEPNNTVDIHTVQYLIRELQEERDSVDQLLEEEVSIRHCAACGAGFAQETDFNEHLKNCEQSKKIVVIKRTQNKNNKHLCPYCEKAFPRPCRLKNHLRKHPEQVLASKLKEAEQNQNKYKCPHCDLSFSLESNFKYHLSYHTKEKEFNRSFLEQNLKKKIQLNRHLINHINIKKHKCKECGKEFEWASQLKNHMLDHRNPPVCKLCQKKFIHEHQLKMHSILIHNDEKPFKCKHCGTGFSEKDNLIFHQRKHLCRFN